MSIPSLRPYAIPSLTGSNRVDWQPDPARAVLLIHDMQRYFLEKYADCGQSPVCDVVDNIEKLRTRCDSVQVPVVYTTQPVYQSAVARALLNDFWGPGLTDPLQHAAQPVIDKLAPRSSDVILTKWRYSAFQRSDLRERMHAWNRDQLIICGVYAHIGCMATALEAFMQDVQPFMTIDGMGDFTQADHQMAIDYVARRCGVSLTAAQIMQALSSKTLA